MKMYVWTDLENIRTAANRIGVNAYTEQSGKGYKVTLSLKKDVKIPRAKVQFEKYRRRGYLFRKDGLRMLLGRQFVCWHGYRDFMREIFRLDPSARIKTCVTDYIGLDDFNDKFEATGNRNVGSMMSPVAYRDLCDCETFLEPVTQNTVQIIPDSVNENNKVEYARLGSDLKAIEPRSIPQKDLTSECWLIQFRGLEACEDCESKNTKGCGGKNIRKTLLNEKGVKVPLGHTIEPSEPGLKNLPNRTTQGYRHN